MSNNQLDLFEPLVEVELNENIIFAGDDNYIDFLEDFSNCKEFGLDLETYDGDNTGCKLTPLRYYANSIRLVQIGLRDGRGLLFDVKKKSEYLPGFLRILKERCENKSVMVYGANLMFEGTNLKHHFNISINQCRDVMILSKLVNNGITALSSSNGLKGIAEWMLGMELNKDEQKSNWGLSLTNTQLNYAYNDVKYLFPMMDGFRKLGRELNLTKVFKIECDALPAFIDMTMNGMPIDRQYLESIFPAYQAAMQSQENEWYKGFDDAGLQRVPISFSSKNKTHCELVRAMTGEAFVKFDKKALALSKHPAVIALLNYRSLKKAHDTAAKMLNCRSKNNQRIYGAFQSLGTVSGRPACKGEISKSKSKWLYADGINLLNVPNPPRVKGLDVELKPLRTAIKSPEGRKLVIVDASQCHPKLLAQFSNDPALLDVFMSGKDVYCVLAVKIAEKKGYGKEFTHDFIKKYAKKEFDEKLTPICKQLRNWAKETFLAKQNAEGANGLKERFKKYDVVMSKEEAKDLLKTWEEAFPLAFGYQHALVGKAASSTKEFRGITFGLVKSKYGRRLNTPMYRRSYNGKEYGDKQAKINDCCSFRWMGTEADFMKISFTRIFNILQRHPMWNAKLVNFVYDEIVVECDEPYAETVTEIVSTVMLEEFSKVVTAFKPDSLPENWSDCVAETWAEK